jgi:flagellar basal-body rod protein FlgF
MIRGIYTAAAGLATATLRLGVVSNNVANAATPGYKQDILPEEVGKPLELLRWAVDRDGKPVGSITLGPRSGLSELDLSSGPMQATDNPLDLAIAGTGFFAVQGADGETRYTRDGGFMLDVDGSLRSRSGAAVLGEDGQPIVLGQGQVDVASDGTVLIDGAPAARLQMVEFAPGQQLIKQGQGLFAPEPGAPAPQAATNSQLYQGYLEGSNVDMTESMVATMNLVRAYGANQHLLQIQDETLQKAVSDIGRVA